VWDKVWLEGIAAMTSKERMLAAMGNGQPDCVPVAPDISNMIPSRLTGKQFWDIYLYEDPPLWRAYIDAVRHFGFDGWLPGVPLLFDYERQELEDAGRWREAIVGRTQERIYTRYYSVVDGQRQWSNDCTVYYVDDPPTHGVPLGRVGLSGGPPGEWQDVERRACFGRLEDYYAACEHMGQAGVVGLAVHLPGVGLSPEAIYEYYDSPDLVFARCQEQHERILRRTRRIVELRPDFVHIGISGFMISNPEPIFRKLALPTLKEVTRICREAQVISQIHCCGPQYDLVRMAAEETHLCGINPLEIPPMGDCDLGRIKKEFGKKLSLMGNLHTTDVMLRGSAVDVEQAAKTAIDQAAEGGGFILSTGDQCGRDTPDENIYAMIDAARTYGRY